MAKYKITVPDANKPAIRISGIKLNDCPFEKLGTIILKKTKSSGGRDIYFVENSDFEKCFPVSEHYWNIGDIFCNSCNSHIHDYSWDRFTQEYKQLRHKSNFPLYSKHKIDDSKWLVAIYNPQNSVFDLPIEELTLGRKEEAYINI